MEGTLTDITERAPVTARETPAVTRWGMGTAAIGYLYTPVDTDNAVETVRAAYAAGVRYFDTAPLYGAGQAETRLGLALQTVPRDAVILSTKVGYRIQPGGGVIHDYRADAIQRSLDMSLTRLQTDHVDIVLIHDPDDHYDAAQHEAFPVLRRWRDEGVVGAIGLGVNQSALPTRFLQDADLDCVLLAGRYTLLDQSALDDLLPVALAKGVRIVVGGPFNSGILADPWDPAPRFNYRPADPEWIERARAIDRICQRYGVPIQAAALQFPLGHPAVATVLTGMRAVREVTQNAAGWNQAIPKTLWLDLRDAGLVRADAPLPTS